MDRYSRFIGLAFVIAWTIFRLVRYWKVGASRRPPPAVPASGAGLAAPPIAAPATPPGSPLEAASGAGFVAGLVAVIVWLAGNAVVWACLFLLPQLEAVPVIPRLVAGVLASFYLLYVARGAAARVRRQSGRTPPAGGDPIS
ncbi:MAG TPA: hypothetical protein VMU44_02960 [Steroidobacteraceae bacterium]|nr:hypothetical protein [Steroidobacteraceae bacterium]